MYEKINRMPREPIADKLCCLLIVTAAVTLLAMGYCELCKVRSRASSTCGMRSEINSLGRSAKRTAVSPSVNTEEGQHLHLNDEWLDDSASNCKHEELKQDEASLAQTYSWDASAEEEKKFVKIDKDKIRMTANTKPLNPNSVLDEPSHSKVLGMSHPMHKLYITSHGSDDGKPKFGNACSWFNGNEAYYSARSKGNHCDCLREDCETCTRQ